MPRLLALVMILALAAAAPARAAPTTDPAHMPAGTYVLDKRHASLTARVRHMGLSLYTARFNGFDARFDYDPKAPEASKIEVTVDANSIDTGDPAISKQFAKQFLDAGDHPTITFVSTEIRRTEGARGVIKGDLTLRGVTKPVELEGAFDGYESGLGGQRAGFSAVGRIDRTEFGSKFLSPGIVADEVELVIEVEFVRK
jgi:polyisoprenoid-binding protein YceI